MAQQEAGPSAVDEALKALGNSVTRADKERCEKRRLISV